MAHHVITALVETNCSDASELNKQKMKPVKKMKSTRCLTFTKCQANSNHELWMG